MSKADEMFKELGFSKLEEINKENRFTIYRNIQGKNINFSNIIKRIWVDGNYSFITTEELAAINEKVKELGWIDNKTNNT